MENVKEKNHTYWGWRAKGYSEYNQQELEDVRKKNWKIELESVIAEQFPGKKAEKIKVLDVGAGPGFFSILAAELGLNVTAVDFASEMIAEAKANAGALADQINWTQGDAQALPFADGSFDLLITRNVTWNLPDPEAAYKDWYRVLKWDGVLVNYDANWYHYLFDEEKKEAFELDRRNASAENREDCNVGEGFDVMETIAREIPMGKMNRPEWDWDVMDMAGYYDIRIDKEVWKRVWSEDEKVSCASTPMFRIIGKKTPTEKRIVNYWTERSDSFMDQRRAELHDSIADRWLKEIEEVLPAGRTLKILDVGCGTGFFSILLGKRGHDLTGIDLTPDMIEKSKLLAKEEQADCHFQVMNAEELDFADETFDVVISRNLTWTLPHPDKAYREWLRVLKEGGILLNFDADYGKEDDSDLRGLPETHAHHMVGQRMRLENVAIKRQLSISFQRRPYWDLAALSNMGVEQFTLDMGTSSKIYLQVDEFLNPVPIFRLTAKKPGQKKADFFSKRKAEALKE